MIIDREKYNKLYFTENKYKSTPLCLECEKYFPQYNDIIMQYYINNNFITTSNNTFIIYKKNHESHDFNIKGKLFILNDDLSITNDFDTLKIQFNDIINIKTHNNKIIKNIKNLILHYINILKKIIIFGNGSCIFKTNKFYCNYFPNSLEILDIYINVFSNNLPNKIKILSLNNFDKSIIKLPYKLKIFRNLYCNKHKQINYCKYSNLFLHLNIGNIENIEKLIK
jgi:hypothetical protein